jgi:hypothetical protein
MNYTKDQCLQWIKTPHINPKTQKIIQKEKATFLGLLKECKTLLSFDEVNQANPEVLKWIFPNGNPTPAQVPVISEIEIEVQKPIDLGEKPKVIMDSDPVYQAYTGEIKDGIPHGKGHVLYKTGSVYEGQFMNGHPEGQGKLTKSNGDVYEGQFVNGLPDGEGILTSLDGTSKSVKYNKGLIVLDKANKKLLLKEKLKAKSQPQIPDPNLGLKLEHDVPDLEPTHIDAKIDNNGNGNGEFQIPAKINYTLEKMNEANKLKLANQSSKKLITEAEFAKLMSSDAFMSQLLQGERKLVSYKKVQYKKLIMQIETALNDPLLKAGQENDPIAKLMGKEDDAVKDLNKKLESLKTNAEIIDSRLKELGDDLTFNSKMIADKRQKINKILTDPENGINTLLGDTREDIRRTLLAKIVSFGKAPELYINRFNNYNIMGPAGSGKTKLAGILGNFFYNLGILNTSKVIYVTRADLVAGYIGQTAPLTRQYLSSTLEGVFFIDEAYQLSGCPDKKGEFSNKDFGAESITEIVNYVDKHIGLSVVIGAGYEEEMNRCFLKINEGMRRRFPNNLRLINYSSKDLSTILYSQVKKMFDKQILTPSQITYIDLVIENLNNMKSKDPEQKGLFGNQAGDMLNLSNTLIQDLVLNQKKGYLIENINNSFTRFFISKGLQVMIKI